MAKNKEKPKSIAIDISRQEMKEFSLIELAGLFDAVRTMRDIGLAMSNQPRFQSKSEEFPECFNYNLAGKSLEKIICFFDRCETELADLIRNMPCEDEWDVDRKYERLMLYDSAEGFEHIHKLLSDALGDLAQIRLNKKRAAA